MGSSIAYDLRYLEAALDLLEDFIKSPEIYWSLSVSPPPGEPPYPQLSLGNVLLALQRLQRPLEKGEEAALREAHADALDRIRQRYRAVWEQKAVKEARMRARLWAQYIAELAKEPSSKAYYAAEVRNRAILELLRQEATLPDTIETLRAHADRRLQSRFEPGEFIWDEDLAPAFPSQTFWYLYGQPR